MDRIGNGGGGWRAACFILAMEAAERLAFYSLAANLVTYLISGMHQSLPSAVTTVSNWIGAAYILGIPGGFLADSYLGRFHTIVLHSLLYIAGLTLITASAMAPALRPPAAVCASDNGSSCVERAASEGQEAVLMGGLYLVAVGTGGIKACASAFGADQFQIARVLEPEAAASASASSSSAAAAAATADGSKLGRGNSTGKLPDTDADTSTDTEQQASAEPASFFGWFFFAVNIGALLAFTGVVYAQERFGWGAGAGIALGAMLASLSGLGLGSRVPYVCMPPAGSPLTRFLRVLVAAARNRNRSRNRPQQLFELDDPAPSYPKLPHTDTFRWLDKAAIPPSPSSPWRLCTVTQVEELKLCLRLLPIVATTLFLWTGYTQLVTLFVKQGSTMERRIGHGFEIPPASLPIFSVANALVILPLYEKVAVPLLRRRKSGGGFTPLQRMGFGLAMSVCAMLAAALVEQKRRNAAVSAGLADDPAATVPMSIFWLVPQYFLVGLAEIFTYVAQLHFFYAEASPGLRSLSTSLFISELGIGSWISSLLVTIVRRATGGDDDRGWITDNINRSKIDRFYWLLAALSALNFGLFLVAASRHRYRADL